MNPLISLCLVVLIITGIESYRYYKSPEFSLKKNEWNCTKKRTYYTTNMIIAGKVTVPQRVAHTQCEQWNKK